MKEKETGVQGKQRQKTYQSRREMCDSYPWTGQGISTHWKPSVRSTETGQDTVTQHEAEHGADENACPESQKDNPTTRTGAGLTRSEEDKSSNKKIGAKMLTEGGTDRLDPLITTDVNKHVTPGTQKRV